MKTYTDEEIHIAFHRAADHIEQYPSMYGFCYLGVPDSEGQQGPGLDNGALRPGACMWGWVGYFLGERRGTKNWEVAESAGLVNTAELYWWGDREDSPWKGYEWDYKVAANMMRAFADAKFAPAAPALDPAFVAFKEGLEETNLA